MIPAQDLRIGNLVWFDGNILPIEVISEDEAKAGSYCHPEHLKPISFTEKIFSQLGMLYEDKTRSAYIDNFAFFHNERLSGKAWDVFIGGKYISNVNYVHEWQNLYYFIKGVELPTNKLTNA